MNELMLYGTVGVEITAADVVAKLGEVEGDAVVRVNSYGGDAFEGVAVMNALRSHSGQVTVVVDGVAASSASLIAVGGADRLVMRPGSELMVHDAWTFADGNPAELEKLAADLERTSQSMAEVYAAKSGGDVEQWRDMMRVETWFSAQEAVDAGLADAVEDGRVQAEPVLVASGRGPRFAYAGRSHAPKPEILKEENGVTLMHEVAKRLGLVATDVDEETVLAALEETLAEQAEPETEAEAEAEPEAVEATAETVADENASAEEEEPAEFAEEPAEDSDAPETVTLPREVFDELKAAAAAGAQARETERINGLNAEVDQWIADGQAAAASRADIRKSMYENPEATRRIYQSVPKGTIPRAEVGYGVDPIGADVELTKEQKTQALIKRANELAQARK